MRPSVVAWIITAGVLSVGLLLGNLHPFGDPRTEPQKGLGTLLHGANMPADAKAILVAKCADCHSSETRWPRLCADRTWVVADRARHRRGARKNGSVAMGGNAGGEARER